MLSKLWNTVLLLCVCFILITKVQGTNGNKSNVTLIENSESLRNVTKHVELPETFTNKQDVNITSIIQLLNSTSEIIKEKLDKLARETADVTDIPSETSAVMIILAQATNSTVTTTEQPLKANLDVAQEESAENSLASNEFNHLSVANDLSTPYVDLQAYGHKNELDDMGSHESRIRVIDVKLSLGTVRGRIGKTESKRKIFYGFRAMQYAEPPKRFEPSIPVKPWQGIYDATEDRHSCIQIPDSDSGIPESEDCLYINVYTPQLPDKKANTTKLLPVMFWIHGGAQMNGDSSYNYYGPDYFLEENVVIVTINFRIGVFGFLSTGDAIVPGNNGLKDILLGLQWVQSHIEKFNGNPQNVTLFGESAGAAMVMYLAQSPLTQGRNYFNKVIAQSGNTLCPWSFQRSPRDVSNRIAVATLCGLFIFDSQLMVNCLKQVDVNVLKLAALGVFLGDSGFLVGILNGLAFAPSVEPPHENAIVTNKSYELLKNGEYPDVPYILGVNSEEALVVADNLTLLRPLLLQMDAAPGILVPADMYASFFDSVLNVATQIRNFYFDFAPITLNSNAKIIKYLSDHFFDRPTRESVALLSKRAPVYYYRFSYFGKLGLWKTTIDGLGKVQHGADLNYIWRTSTKTFNNTDLNQFSKMDKLVRSRLIRMWTNFAKTGNPTPNVDVLLENKIWPKANAIKNSTDIICMDIGEHLKLVRNPDNNMFTMWKQLYNTFGKPTDTF